jgi:hypothetical protein
VLAVVTVNTDPAVPRESNVTLFVFNDKVGLFDPPGEIELERLTVPEKPVRLVRLKA